MEATKMFRVYTLKELCEEVDAEQREQAQSRQWGSWRLDPERSTLKHDCGYEVYLDDMTDSAQILDWIFQVYNKTWATPTVIRELLRALHDILNPQANYCSYGGSTTADPDILMRAFCKGREQ